MARTGPRRPREAPPSGHASATSGRDNRVVGTTQDSNVFRRGGTWTLTVEPRNGAGSHIRVVLERRFKGKGWLFYPAVALFGRRMFKRNLQKTLNVLGRSGS